MIVAFAGGVGGAKLAAGLARVLAPEDLLIVVNTGDDFEHLGLHVSPDLDTVLYTLAGLANPQQGWGRRDETWSFMESLSQLGGPGWFRLGDRDLALHAQRTRRLAEGASLSEVTHELCAALGVRHTVVPMTDARVRTIVHTDRGELEFQHYFVRERCEPRVLRLEYRGAAAAQPSRALMQALARHDLAGIVFCPSNPYLSIAPMLALPGVREAIAGRALAVSPIIGGRAVKGPAAKIMQEFGGTASALEVARGYVGVADALLIDHGDAALAEPIEALGVHALVDDILMRDDGDRERLARACVAALGRS